MNCPKCGIEWKCGCKSCSDRNVQGETLAIFSGDFASCGYCGLKMHHEEWADEEHRQYEGMKKMKDQKTVEQMAVTHANVVDDPEYATWHGRYSSFKAGHASRDQEVAEKDKRIEAIRSDRDALDNGNILLNEKLTAANQRIEKLRGALKFYSNKKDWHECIASSDVSESIQDGDFFYAFDQGEDCPWWTALETLQDDKDGV